jgi:hypothetical protein
MWVVTDLLGSQLGHKGQPAGWVMLPAGWVMLRDTAHVVVSSASAIRFSIIHMQPRCTVHTGMLLQDRGAK